MGWDDAAIDILKGVKNRFVKHDNMLADLTHKLSELKLLVSHVKGALGELAQRVDKLEEQKPRIRTAYDAFRMTYEANGAIAYVLDHVRSRADAGWEYACFDAGDAVALRCIPKLLAMGFKVVQHENISVSWGHAK